MNKSIKVVESNSNKSGELRYVVIDTATGEVLDDAQGYGYKSVQKAYAGYTYKTRDKSKDKEKAEKDAHIRNWMKAHKDFVNLMDAFAVDIAKGSAGEDEKFDAKFVGAMLKERNLEVDFKPSELLRVWKKG